MELEGRTVLFTGAAGGLGADSALAFMREGAEVVCVDIDERRSLPWRSARGESARVASSWNGWTSPTCKGWSAASRAWGGSTWS
jgi:NAD(P)-dependent dehydrogenase (short-subunit alcohol dehydrogenase family)